MEHEENAKASEAVEEVEEVPVPLGTQVTTLWTDFFFKVEVHINVQHFYISNGPYAHRFYISNNFISRELSKYRGVLHCEGDFLDEIMEASFCEPYFTRTTNMLSRPDCFILYGKVGIDLLPTSELLYSMMKVGLSLIRALFNFLKVTDNPNLSLGIFDRSLYTPRIDLKDDYHKKQWTCLHILFWNTTTLRLWQRRLSILANKIRLFTNFFKKCSSSSKCNCNEYKISIHCIAYWKSILLSAIQLQTN